MITARGRADRAAVLLRAGYPVRKTIISRDVIDLRSWLVVPRAPRRGTVYSHNRALIARDDHSFRIVRIDPELVIVVAAGRAFDRRPRLARISRAIHRRVHHVNDVCVLRIDGDLFEVPAAVPQSLVARQPRPRGAAVVRSKHAAFLSI